MCLWEQDPSNELNWDVLEHNGGLHDHTQGLFFEIQIYN